MVSGISSSTFKYENKGLDRYLGDVHKDFLEFAMSESQVGVTVKFDSFEYEFDYWGRKRISKVKKATITIFKHEHRNEKGIKETIIHELIHTLKGCQNHKSEFKWHCEIIRSHLGYSCLSGQHEDTQSNDYLENYKHFLVCTHCNKIVGKGIKFTQPYQHPETRICCTCRKSEIVYKNLQQIKEWLA